MPRRGKKRSPAASMRLGVLLLGLAGINVYVFFLRGGTSLRDVLKAQSTHAAAPGGAVDGDPLAPPGAAGAGPKTLPPEKVPPPVLEDEDARRVEGKMEK